MRDRYDLERWERLFELDEAPDRLPAMAPGREPGWAEIGWAPDRSWTFGEVVSAGEVSGDGSGEPLPEFAAAIRRAWDRSLVAEAERVEDRARAGFPPMAVDGVFGPRTWDANFGRRWAGPFLRPALEEALEPVSFAGRLEEPIPAQDGAVGPDSLNLLRRPAAPIMTPSSEPGSEHLSRAEADELLNQAIEGGSE